MYFPMKKALAAVVASAVVFGVAGISQAQDEKPWRLTVMHTNDTHSHHEPQSSGDGGAARQASLVKAIRAEAANSLLLDAGDRFTGTLFHKYHLGQDQVAVMNALGYQAMALGNHEFDNGIEILANFIKGSNFPVLAANLEISKTPELADIVKPSVVLDVNGEKVGVIGIVTADTPEITIAFAGKENLIFSSDYATAVNAEAAKLMAEGVNKIILLSHIGFGEDMELAKLLKDVDIIIGGHSHTLLSNLYKEAGDNVYPVVAKDSTDANIYIVQTGDRTRFLGRIDLDFNKEGIVTRAVGDTILLQKYMPVDAEMAAIVSELAAPVNELKATPVLTADGNPVETLVELSNSTCRAGECVLGNLVADAMRAEAGAQIAITNGGGLRSTIDVGPITVGEVLTVLPFGNTVATMQLKGADVVAALESGVSRVGGSGGTGRFPQVSGLRFTFDAAKEPGSRVTVVEVWQDGAYVAIDPEATYAVATNNFMRTGGDGYVMFRDNAVNPYDFGRTLDEVFAEYLAKNAPVNVAAEGRITVENPPAN
jgi:5'-nucleotidase / UDP-sugar diphosphatase